jgi:hypothetical protein
MFSTQEFFKNNPDTKLASHSDTVAKWLLSKLRIKFPALNRAIKIKKFDPAMFIEKWSPYVKELTPFDIKRAWKYIDIERKNIISPNLEEFKQIVSKTRARSMTYDEIHQEAMSLGAVVQGCRCGYCYEQKGKISISPTEYFQYKLN